MPPATRFLPFAGKERWTLPVSYSSPDEWPQVDPTTLRQAGTGQGIFHESPLLTRHFHRDAPDFIDDPDNTGLFSHIQAATYASPAIFTAAADDAVLCGYRTLISGSVFFDDQMFLSSEAQSRYLDRLASIEPFPNEDTRLRRQEDGRFVLEQSGQTWRHFEGTAIILCSTEPSNYGSFLFRVLPKVATLKKLGLLDLPVVCWNIHPASQSLLEMAGVNPRNIIWHDTHAVTRFDRVIVPGLQNPDAYLDTETRAFYAELRKKFGEPQGKRRLYVSRYVPWRQSMNGRIMLNEAELIERLAAIGFDIIAPETLPSREQVRLFSSAEVVVGPSGSGMFNTVFCHPGTKVVDIESEPDWIYAHTGLFGSCGMRYGLFCGTVDPADKAPVHRRWTVNIEALLSRLDQFLKL